MRTSLGLIAVFSLIFLMIIPVHADVTSATIDKATFSIIDKFTISGVVDDDGGVLLTASMKGPSSSKSLNRNAYSTGTTFSFTPIDADTLFKREGTYTITVFTENQLSANGTVIKIGYENSVATVLPDYELILESIGDKQIDETEVMEFTASVTDSEIKNEEYFLISEPNGATIHKDTGKFSWTPTNSQSGKYVFDVIVKSGPLDDKETITVIVADKPVVADPTPKPDPTPAPTPTPTPTPAPVEPVEPTKPAEPKEPEPVKSIEPIEPGEPKKMKVASFVNETRDAQSYVDRYNNEPSYMKWFDENFAEYDSIYHAVGLDEPKVEEKVVVKEEIGECGKGTDLINGTCIIIVNPEEEGGCLIATATYGSEMAPQVQYLREIRDNQLMNTESGISFMSGFNQLYYSFSPHIADIERENPVFKEMVKIGITPLLSSLSIMSYAETESEVTSYGIGVILMNLGMYVGLPAIIIFKTRKYIKIQ